MVTARLAIGSVSTLALGALLLGSAPYLLHRNAGGSQASPWGAVSGLGVGQSVAAQSEDDRAQLLKLAALKSGSAPETSGSPSASPAPAPATSPVPEAQPVAQSSAMPEQSPAEQTAAASSAAPVDAPQQVASLEAPVSTQADKDDGAAAKGDRININTATANALDHLPGAGRIGHTIVSHRPYKSVKDLVSRRILRTSDFQKIQARISID